MKYKLPKQRKLVFAVYHCTHDGESEYGDTEYAFASNGDEAERKVRKDQYPKSDFVKTGKNTYESKHGDYRIWEVEGWRSDAVIQVEGTSYNLNKVIRYQDFPSATQRLDEADIVLTTGENMEYHWRLPNGDFIFINTCQDDRGGMGIMPFKDAQANLNILLRTGWEVLKFFDQEI